jgi:hypothetical protein
MDVMGLGTSQSAKKMRDSFSDALPMLLVKPRIHGSDILIRSTDYFHLLSGNAGDLKIPHRRLRLRIRMKHAHDNSSHRNLRSATNPLPETLPRGHWNEP